MSHADSTARDDFASSNTIDQKLIPTDIDNDPISWDGNPAHVEGALFEAQEFYKRTGTFQPLIENRVVLSGRYLVCESSLAVPFIKGMLSDKAEGYSFEDPCPPTAARIQAYDAIADEASTPKFNRADHTEVPDSMRGEVTVNKYTVQVQLRALANSLSHIIANGTKRQAMLKAANYDGTELIKLLYAEAKKAKPQDIALVNTKMEAFRTRGLVGELTLKSFDDHMKAFRKLEINQAPSSRLAPGGVVQMINTIMYRDPGMRDKYELHCLANSVDPNDLEANIDRVQELLRSREVASQIDDITTNGGVNTTLAATNGDNLTRAIAGKDGKAILAALVTAGIDPVKDLKLKAKRGKGDKDKKRTDIPRNASGKPSKWIEGKMEPCECRGVGAPGGVNDGGKHLYSECTIKTRKERKEAGDKLQPGGGATQSSNVVEFDEDASAEDISNALDGFFASIESADHASCVLECLDALSGSDFDLEDMSDSDTEEPTDREAVIEKLATALNIDLDAAAAALAVLDHDGITDNPDPAHLSVSSLIPDQSEGGGEHVISSAKVEDTFLDDMIEHEQGYPGRSQARPGGLENKSDRAGRPCARPVGLENKLDCAGRFHARPAGLENESCESAPTGEARNVSRVTHRGALAGGMLAGTCACDLCVEDSDTDKNSDMTRDSSDPKLIGTTSARDYSGDNPGDSVEDGLNDGARSKDRPGSPNGSLHAASISALLWALLHRSLAAATSVFHSALRSAHLAVARPLECYKANNHAINITLIAIGLILASGAVAPNLAPDNVDVPTSIYTRGRHLLPQMDGAVVTDLGSDSSKPPTTLRHRDFNGGLVSGAHLLGGGVLLLMGMMYFWPASFVYTVMRAPMAAATSCAYLLSLPLAWAFPRRFASIIDQRRVVSTITASLNRVRFTLPFLVSTVILLSRVCIIPQAGPTTLGDRETGVTGPGHSPPVGYYFNSALAPLPTNVEDANLLTGRVDHMALPCAADVQAHNKLAAVAKSAGLPLVLATPDSGATASNTNDCKNLVNTRDCNEVFGDAYGRLTRATAIGDLPVIANTSEGQLVHFTFSNVRCVPDFKYTLLSVKQLWAEQGIDCRWRDLNRLELPTSAGGHSIPFDKTLRLSTLVLVSAAKLGPKAVAALAASARVVTHDETSLASPSCEVDHVSLAGFHAPSSVSHVRNLSSAQAAELMHRRLHAGVTRMRALPHTTRDATSNLTSAPQCTCPYCAAANAKRTSHSGSLTTPTAEPGKIHLDLKGPFPRSVGGYMYAAIFVDEFSRFIWFEPLKAKSEVRAATERVIANFNATVATRTDESGKPFSRPRVRELRFDHEGGLMSYGFAAFREREGLHLSLSPPHDHDLNPIAERAIGVIDTLATTMREQAKGPIGYWPWFINNAVEVHNATISSTGSSTADSVSTPFQNFTHTQPKVMDLCTLGSRAVALKAPANQAKGQLKARGEIGTFLGRSTGFLNPIRSKSVGTYDVLVNGVVREVSSVQVDEEYMMWWGPEKGKWPLTPTTRHSNSTAQQDEPLAPSVSPGVAPASLNDSGLTLLSLFSGDYHRTNGLPTKLKSHGWHHIVQIDNDGEKGGGSEHDLLNDELYDRLLREAREGRFHGLMIAFPCSTFSVARMFDASTADPNEDQGPPPVRDAKHPDGKPETELDPSHAKELHEANRLLDRTVKLAIAAYHSSSKATIIIENPADRSEKDTVFYAEDLSDHGSLFNTSAFLRLKEAIPLSSRCTLAQCRVGGQSQKYTTLWYTNDAASVLDPLNGPEFKCNHREKHPRPAGGRGPSGEWLSKAAAAYPDRLNTILAQAFTAARTGSAQAPNPAPVASKPNPPDHLPTSSIRTVEPAEPLTINQPVYRGQQPPGQDDEDRSKPYLPPRSPVTFSGFEVGSSPNSPSPSIEHSIEQPPEPAHPQVQGRAERAVRASTRSATFIKDGRSSQATVRVAAERQSAPGLPTIEEAEPDPSYVSFTGSPMAPSGYVNESLAAQIEAMESCVADLVYDASIGGDPRLETVSDWVEVALTTDLLGKATRVDVDTWIVEVDASTENEAQTALLADAIKIDKEAYQTALLTAATTGSLPVVDYLPMFHALRADSAGAPENHRQAERMGEPWPTAEAKELGNHLNNKSWTRISIDQLPSGRRIHKLVWVYKLKRDGTAKARLCVQGCTLEGGVDYDQTFASTLKYPSARALFAYAARRGCKVRSIDFVAAYLQGSFVEGEVVYCRMPDGYVEHDTKGRPYILRIEKPIYGIQQAGRRLQRAVVEWMTNMGLRQLDDSDNCVWVYDDPKNSETFAVGIYVDNLQVVHSVELDGDGNPTQEGTFYGKFMAQLRTDWDIVDEGPMTDLLGIQVKYNENQSITLHQQKYIEAMLKRFYPKGLPSTVARSTLPYTSEIRKHVIEALELDAGTYPDLVTPFQQRVGSLMYCCTATRPDIAFVVHHLCRCMAKPTPALMNEVDHVFSYLSRHRAVGLTFSSKACTLHGFSDASWEVHRSTSGWFIFWQDCALTWGSRKQPSTALSSCEAEIIALSEAAKDMVYFRKLVRGLDKTYISGPSDLSTDNQAARDLSYNPEGHDRSKHVARRHFFIRDMVEAFELNVPLVPTKNNPADFLTKPLGKAEFFALRSIFMNEADAGARGNAGTP